MSIENRIRLVLYIHSRFDFYITKASHLLGPHRIPIALINSLLPLVVFYASKVRILVIA